MVFGESSAATPSSPSYYSDDPEESASQYSSYSAYTADSLPTDRSAFEVRGGLGDWIRSRLSDASRHLKHAVDEFGAPILFTPRDAPAVHKKAHNYGPRPTRAGRIAAIPWRELVGLKESLLTNMEGAAAAAERLDDSEAVGGQHAAALQRTVADLDTAIRELQQVAEADALETEAIAADLRRQVEGLRAEHAAVEQSAQERKLREIDKGNNGLMGQVARQHEAKFIDAKHRHAAAKARLGVHVGVMSREVREVEVRGLAPAAAASSTDGAEPTAATEAAAEKALASTIERLEQAFSHVRAPPPMRAPALVARWRRLQLGEPFGLVTGGAGGTSQRVWLSLTADVRALAIAPAKAAPPSRVLPLAEVIHMSSEARLLTLQTVRGEAVSLEADDAPMLVFWYAGLQDLASLPPAERTSRGALLWRAARHLWRAKRQQLVGAA